MYSIAPQHQCSAHSHMHLPPPPSTKSNHPFSPTHSNPYSSYSLNANKSAYPSTYTKCDHPHSPPIYHSSLSSKHSRNYPRQKDEILCVLDQLQLYTVCYTNQCNLLRYHSAITYTKQMAENENGTNLAISPNYFGGNRLSLSTISTLPNTIIINVAISNRSSIDSSPLPKNTSTIGTSPQ